MAQYIIPQGEFIALAETSGTIQNDSNVVLELSENQEANTGIRLYPHETKSFSAIPQYVRAVGSIGPGVAHVVGFMETIPDGGDGDGVTGDRVATDEEVNNMLDEVYDGT